MKEVTLNHDTVMVAALSVVSHLRHEVLDGVYGDPNDNTELHERLNIILDLLNAIK